MSSLAPSAAAAALLLAPALAAQAVYVDNTQNAGLTGEHIAGPGHPSVMMIGGGTIGDFNNDSYPDLYVPSGGTRPDFLYINDGDGTWTESSAAWGLTDLHFGVGSAVGDFDNDGWQDLYVCSFGPASGATLGHNKLYRNNGDGTFTDVALSAGVNAPSTMNDAYGAAFGDFDRDGDLDLFVAAYSFGTAGNTLYENNGDGTFSDVTAARGITDINTTRGLVSNFVDLDRDGHTDILLIADTGTSKFFHNQGDNTFVKRNTYMPSLRYPNGMGLAVADFDNDHDLDFYVSDIYYPASGIGGNRLFVSDGTGKHWEDRGAVAGVGAAGWAWGAVATDMDDDGWQDIIVTNGWTASWDNYPTRVFHNSADGTFAEVAAGCGIVNFGQGRSLLRLDADQDGDEDLILTESNGPLSYYQNETNNGNHWLRISLNTDAVDHLAPGGHGTEVVISSPSGQRSLLRHLDSNQSYLGQNEMVIHAGLGPNADEVDVRVYWADGTESFYPKVAVDQHLEIHASQPVLTTTPALPNQKATLQIAGLVPDGTVLLAVSPYGGGPVSTVWGDLMVTPPYKTFPLPVDAQGVAEMDVYVKGWRSGDTYWLHAFDQASNSFSNPLSVTVQ